MLTMKSHCHELGLVFYYPGLYKIEIQCTGSTMDPSSSQPINEDIKLIVKETNEKSSRNVTCAPSSWKCSPLIEISVA